MTGRRLEFEAIKVELAIFARTPGKSIPKGRLAAQMPNADVSKLYELSLAACTELAHELMAVGVKVCWAVAEQDCVDDEYWCATGLPAVYSGFGTLGSRLSHVYETLLSQADVAVMMGSDSPQLRVKNIELAWQASLEKLPVVGPSNDGGFYLFAGAQAVPAERWEQVEYSTTTTLAQLKEAMSINPLHLETQPDFDDVPSLAEVVAAMPQNPLAAQAAFISKATELLETHSLLKAMPSA